jgi:hypothetical protein
LSGVEPRVFIFRKRAAPAVGEIKDRHVENEHGVVPMPTSSKKPAQPIFKIVFTLSGFHCDVFCVSPMLTKPPACNHGAVVGFVDASFEGGKKNGVSGAGLLGFGVLDCFR